MRAHHHRFFPPFRSQPTPSLYHSLTDVLSSRQCTYANALYCVSVTNEIGNMVFHKIKAKFPIKFSFPRTIPYSRTPTLSFAHSLVSFRTFIFMDVKFHFLLLHKTERRQTCSTLFLYLHHATPSFYSAVRWHNCEHLSPLQRGLSLLGSDLISGTRLFFYGPCLQGWLALP